MISRVFYGSDQALIHHVRFGDLAREAATLVRAELAKAGLAAGTVVDLGSGSGIYAAAMVSAGYDVVGVDISPAMVELARAAAPGATFTVGSLHDFALPECVAVTALGEALNYATDERAGLDALALVAQRARAALAPRGVFAFDVATPGRGGPDGNRMRFFDHGDWALGMLPNEDHDARTLDRAITIFVRDDDGRWRRVDEHHVLRLYDERDVVERVTAAGFRVDVLGGYGALAPFPGWKVFVAHAT